MLTQESFRPYKNLQEGWERFMGPLLTSEIKNCIPWTGAKGGNQKHGQIRILKKLIYSHRLSWEVHFGPIPKGRVVCHKCDSPICVNPYHLFLGTQSSNLMDAARKGRWPGRLSKDIADQIRAECAPKRKPLKELSAKYGVSMTAISYILNRRTYE